MIIVPARNFARSLLMIFILYCLVIRTLYQGGLFENLQSEDLGHTADTITEMLDRGFKFYMMFTSLEHTENTRFKKK